MTYYRLKDHGNTILKEEENCCSVFVPYEGIWKETKQSFPDAESITDEEAELYLLAVETAKTAHQGQKDKGGHEYINHPLTVSSFVQGPFVSVIAALLHDVVEDTQLTLKDLETYGFTKEILSAVDACTRRKDEPRSVYLSRLSECTDAIYVKLADLKHNSDLSRLQNITQKDLYRAEKYRRETEYLNEILDAKTQKTHDQAE